MFHFGYPFDSILRIVAVNSAYLSIAFWCRHVMFTECLREGKGSQRKFRHVSHLTKTLISALSSIFFMYHINSSYITCALCLFFPFSLPHSRRPLLSLTFTFLLRLVKAFYKHRYEMYITCGKMKCNKTFCSGEMYSWYVKMNYKYKSISFYSLLKFSISI